MRNSWLTTNLMSLVWSFQMNEKLWFLWKTSGVTTGMHLRTLSLKSVAVPIRGSAQLNAIAAAMKVVDQICRRELRLAVHFFEPWRASRAARSRSPCSALEG